MRIDNYLVSIGLFDSRTKARQAIDRGEIYLNSKQILKASFEVDASNEALSVKRFCQSDFVSLGGFKLEKALKDFNLSVENLIVADIGASTGGFTDCLLQNGAKKVFAVDLRDDLLSDKLKRDDRVKMIVKNARDLKNTDFNSRLDMIVADLSFISISMVVDVFSKLLKNGNKLLLLIKPQFEVGKKIKLKNGIIRDHTLHKNICLNVYDECLKRNLAPIAITKAPEVEKKNLEFLFLLEKDGEVKLDKNFVENI